MSSNLPDLNDCLHLKEFGQLLYFGHHAKVGRLRLGVRGPDPENRQAPLGIAGTTGHRQANLEKRNLVYRVQT